MTTDNNQNEEMFEEIAYNLDDYIASRLCPKKEYKALIVPFYIECMMHISSKLNDTERSILLNIISHWNLDGETDENGLQKERKRISDYEETLPIESLSHRYISSILEFMTGQYIKNSEVSIIWLFISGLIRCELIGDTTFLKWLNVVLQRRFSDIIDMPSAPK